MGYQNAKRYFITAKESQSALSLLQQHMGDNALTILESGGVWRGKQRLVAPQAVIQKGETLRVYVVANQGKSFVLSVQRIVFEDSHILVVDKPAGLSSVPDRSHQFYNLTSGVHDYFNSKGIVASYAPLNRLDFGVSGLVLFAKSKPAIQTLTQMTQHRQIMKIYEAVLDPMQSPPRCLRIQNKLGFTGKAHEDAQGKDAHSLFLLKEMRDKNPVYSVILLTGRRHQIRSHAAQFLAPLSGDSWYGSVQKGEIGLRSVGLNFTLFGKRYRLRG